MESIYFIEIDDILIEKHSVKDTSTIMMTLASTLTIEDAKIAKQYANWKKF